MKNRVVNIVRGAWGWKGLGWSKGPRVSRGFPGIEALTSTRAQIRAWERSWAALGVCVDTQNVSGELWKHFGNVLGTLGELWEHFLGACFD